MTAPGGQRGPEDAAPSWRVLVAEECDGIEDLVRAVVPGARPVSVPTDAPPPLRDLVATPDALTEAFSRAAAVSEHLGPRDGIVVPDLPFGGALASARAAIAPTAPVVVVAAWSSALRWWATSGSLPLHGEAGARVDWELAAYLAADLVVAPSRSVADLLAAHLGITAPVVPPSPHSATAPAEQVERVSLGDPPGRPAFPDIARWLVTSGVRTVAVGGSAADDVFDGPTLDAAAPFGDLVVVRDRRRERPDAVLAADPIALPSDRTTHLVARGVPLVARDGSPTAAAHPGAAVFDDAASLRAALSGTPAATAATPDEVRVTAPGARAPHDRARRVSVVVPVHREVRWLEEAVASVLAQTEPVHQVVLVDDGSRDERVTAALARARELDEARIEVLVRPHGGVCRARNAAVEHLTGDAVVFLDSDDVLEPTFLERTATVLRHRPDVVAVATWTRFFGTYDGVEAKPAFDQRVGRRENPIVSTPVLLDRAVLDAGVRFAPELADVYCEDWEVWAHTVALGGRFALVPEALVRHRVHPTSGGHRRTDLALDLGRERATAWLRAAVPSGPLSR